MIGNPNSPKPRPGSMIQQQLERLPEGERLAAAAYLEQRAKQSSDLEVLRAVRDYRQMLANPTSTELPSTD